eukprot:TRINITY_DN7490_c0_g1_i1.p1 TRINITY_DN7490_c0_g1~~TRINITY_DN7490_c0_g1_i1.p1  ORF type:complete len:275 (-),score=59.12 TRINITY_DN7490_c0_g1_i1:26-850(-)
MSEQESNSTPNKNVPLESKLQQFVKRENGQDPNTGESYQSFQTMFKEKYLDEENQLTEQWYEKSKEYWENIEPTVNGMLGGYEHISAADIVGSFSFLKMFINGTHRSLNRSGYCLDVGAGIGRISKNLLSKIFSHIDLLEQCPKFEEEAKQFLEGIDYRFFVSPIQEFIFPEDTKYEVIWIQWVIIYFTDEDFINILKNCAHSLTKDGVIIIKDNVNSDPGFILDTDDSSVTRSEEHLNILFEASNLSVICERYQNNFPENLFPVKIYALAPNK